MKKEVIYKYLGTNGVIESPVHLEDIYYTRYYILHADKGYKLYNGKDYKSTVRTTDEELKNWIEVIDPAK